MKLLYRQKILLAMTEVFGSELKSTDLMKLLLLFCKQQGKDFYSFFPYRFGAFSNDVYKDKRILAAQDIFAPVDHFKIKTPVGALHQLDIKDRSSMISFASNYKTIRGNELIRKTYLQYPEYAKRSEIVNDVLTAKEQETIFSTELFSLGVGVKVVYTIGYEGISIDEYLNRLIKNGITTIIDVRQNPQSMKFDFNRKALENFLSKVDIEYIGIPALGIPGHMRTELSDMNSYYKLFLRYESELLPKQQDKIETIVEIIETGRNIALTCFEKSPEMCHRTRIAKKINKDYKYEIIDL